MDEVGAYEDAVVEIGMMLRGLNAMDSEMRNKEEGRIEHDVNTLCRFCDYIYQKKAGESRGDIDIWVALRDLS